MERSRFYVQMENTDAWQTENPEALNQRRVSTGLPPVSDDPPESESTDESRAEYEHWAREYTQWLKRTGWRS